VNECAVPDTKVITSAHYMDQAAELSGWIVLAVLVMKPPLHSVVYSGEGSTAITLRTSQYRVLMTFHKTQVSSL